MDNSGIRRYERALGHKVRGGRRRKRVREAFRRSLLPLLEEKPAPTYAELNEAFGPPEQMAQELMGTIPDLPKPLSLQQKIGIIIAFCFAVVVVCIGIFFWYNRPESEVIALENSDYVMEALEVDYTSRLDVLFQVHDYTWEQEEKSYVLLVENTNQVATTIYVEYSKIQPSHIFVIPAGEKRAYQVKDACPTEHVVSFATSDGSMNGKMQILFPRAEG